MKRTRASRKMDHITHALETGQLGDTGFSDVKFVHNSLPNTNMNEVKLNTTIGGLSLGSPIIVNAMTGGAEQTYEINRQLAILAKEKDLAIAVGSQMAALKNSEYEYTYKIVRQENPKGIVFANLGAEATSEQAQRAVDMLEASGLQIHLNVVQELVMPEGDRQFKGYLNRIEEIVKAVPCPVIVKEVGFGINGEVARQLTSIGVRGIDVGGYGGTNFAKIENMRRTNTYESFVDWGIKTIPSLVEVSQSSNVDVVASGGVGTPLDAMKSLVVGAKACALAGFLLKLLRENGPEVLHETIDEFHNQMKAMMCALGITRIEEATRVPFIISGESYHWLHLRGYSVQEYARRRKTSD
jgi:isopentenyl-diphosphate delta-isomerase